MIPFGAAAPARNEPTPSGSRWLSFACSRETATSPPAAAGRPTSIVIFAQPGTGRKNADPAPTRTKAIISSRCAQSRLPPARENPGQRGPAVTLSTATFEASPRRPGRTVSRNEPTELAVYMARKPIVGERTVDVHASARSGCTAAQIASPASRKRQSGVAAASSTLVPVRSTRSASAPRDPSAVMTTIVRRPTFTFTASAVRRAQANPWKGERVRRIVGEVARMSAEATRMLNRATSLHRSTGCDGSTESVTMKALERRRAFECRLTPDRALGSVDEAEEFLLDRGLLTRTADSALPSLFGACHEEPYAPASPGFGQWPRTKYPWFGELGARGYPILAVHRGKSLLVTHEVAALLDPLCRAELEGRSDDPLLRHLAEAGPSELEDLQVELGLAPEELKKLRTPLERCGAVVARSIVYEDPHRHTSLLARWDQAHPEPSGTSDPRQALGDLVCAGVRAAVVVPEGEPARWFSWRWYWDGRLVDELVEAGRLVRVDGHVAAG